jgi:sulfur relay (sulfurtransferase) complex TusBCD TusD component (DsrE family)
MQQPLNDFFPENNSTVPVDKNDHEKKSIFYMQKAVFATQNNAQKQIYQVNIQKKL